MSEHSNYMFLCSKYGDRSTSARDSIKDAAIHAFIVSLAGYLYFFLIVYDFYLFICFFCIVLCCLSGVIKSKYIVYIYG